MPVYKKLKNHLVKNQRLPYEIIFGIYKGLKFNINLQNESQIYFGLWERETYPYIKKSLNNCNWMIDVGAGKGELCIYFQLNSHAKTIYAFEPQLTEIDIFNMNIELNHINDNNINISQHFVGTGMEDNFIRLDNISNELKGKGFIKIDVEGQEMDVLKSGESLLTEKVVCLLIETHSEKLEQECIKWLESKGYTVSIINNAWWRFIIPEYRMIEHNRWLWAVNNNQTN